MNFHLYFADVDGRRILVTPWRMVANEGGLREVSAAQLAFEHYRAVADDAAAFYRTAGARSAVLLYEVDSHGRSSGPAMVGSFWLDGPMGPGQPGRSSP